MPPFADKTEALEDVQITFRNFEGRKEKYNNEGDRNFTVILTDDQARRLKADGWAVKQRPKREGSDEEPPFTLKVSVKVDGFKPAHMVLITKKNRTILEPDMAEILDQVELESVDLRIRAYDWHVNGNTGRKAYLVSIWAKLWEDPLAAKYEHLTQIGGNDIPALPAGTGYATPELPPGTTDNGVGDYIDGEVISDSDDEAYMDEYRKELIS